MPNTGDKPIENIKVADPIRASWLNRIKNLAQRGRKITVASQVKAPWWKIWKWK